MTARRGFHHGPDSDQARRRMQRIAAVRAMRTEGATQKQMAAQLDISPATLRNFIDMYAPGEPRRAAAPKPPRPPRQPKAPKMNAFGFVLRPRRSVTRGRQGDE